MIKRLCLRHLATVPLLFALAALAHEKTPEESYFSSSEPQLSKQERQALAIAQEWQEGAERTGIKPFTGRNGALMFVYGAHTPDLVCAVLQVCDIALQAGERVNSIQLGDTARWNVEPAISGAGATEVQHIIVKPLDIGLKTSLLVTTNRRTYSIRLRSHRSDYMPQIGFIYPEDTLAKWQRLRSRKQATEQHSTLAGTGEYLGDLSFNYSVSGYTPWKPVRVYNDGRKTVIEMPDTIQQTEAPTLLVIRRDGSLFSKAQTVIVNYRLQGNRYIVDNVFNKAILVAGVGRHQQKITITRED